MVRTARIFAVTFAVLVGLSGGRGSARAASPDLDLIYSTFLGGSGQEWALSGIAVDSAGRAWVAGSTDSIDYPVLAGMPQEPDWYRRHPSDGYASVLDPDGRLIRSTYLAGRPYTGENAFTFALGPGGNVWIAGWTLDGLTSDVFLMSLEAESPGHDRFKYFDGERDDYALAVTTDAAGTVYMAGYTDSRGFHPPNPRMDQGHVWVMVLDELGVRDLYFNPAGAGHPRAIAVDGSGNIYVAGLAWSSFYTSPNAAQPHFGGGGWDAFVWKLDPSGATEWATFLGGSLSEDAPTLILGDNGDVWVGGWTNSKDFPAHGPALPDGSGTDGYLVRLSPDGKILNSTRLGGSAMDGVESLAIDRRGTLYVGGNTGSPDFPLAGEPGEDWDIFVAILDPETFRLERVLRTGGSTYEGGTKVALDPDGTALHLAGVTASADFPLVAAVQTELKGIADVYVMKIALNRPPDCSAAFAAPASLWPPNGKLRSVSIRGVIDPEGDPVTISVAAIRQDEPLSKKGSPDATGLGTDRPMLRADRSGGGDGRVYHLAFEATDPAGGACSGKVTVCVPHDPKKKTCGDGGALVPSSL